MTNKILFSKRTVESLDIPKGDRVNYYDTKVAGLQLCVSQTGLMTFSVFKWSDGKARRVKLGRYDGLAVQDLEFDDNPTVVLGRNVGLTVEHARKLAVAVLAQIGSGNSPGADRKANSKQITLGELFREYIDRYAMEHTKTWKIMEESFDRYLKDLQNTPVASIKRTDVQALVNKIGKENGTTTANRTLQLLRAVINKGIEFELIDTANPASKIRRFKEKPRDRFIHNDELPALLAAIEAEPKQDIKDFIKMSLYTGVRKSNILSMRWSHVNLATATWTIPETKNDSPQTILLTDNELEILNRRYKERKPKNHRSHDFVFPGTGASGHFEDPKKGWHRILESAKIENLHIHDLRRSLASYMAMTGASLSVIGNAMNHKDVSTTRKVYAQSARETERNARLQAHEKMFGKKKQVQSQQVSNSVEF